MNIYFLAARVKLVKQYQKINNEIQSCPYPLVSRFTSTCVDVDGADTFSKELITHAKLGHCLLKGVLNTPLINQSRAGSTSPNAHTQWLLIDIDGLTGYTPESFMYKIGLGLCTYIVQYSASSGVKPEKGLSCHIFILLDRPIDPDTLKRWLITLNINFFHKQIRLNRLNESLHWPIDITTCQNDKLIYIAPPICIPPELDLQPEPRIQLVSKSDSFFTFPSQIPPYQIDVLRNDLRKQAGIPKSYAEKLDKKAKVLFYPNPQPASISGIKPNEQFTSLNLNGGDSWGYYHLTEEPYFLYNFKGEPVYKISELLPEYWKDLQRGKEEKLREKSQKLIGPTRTILALRDFSTDTYYNGWYDSATNTIELATASTKNKLADFLANYGLQAPESIPDWTCTYNPFSNSRIDIPALQINWFQPSSFMLQGEAYVKTNTNNIADDRDILPALSCPPNISHLIHNVIGCDSTLVEHFLNWTACAFRYRLPNGTAWIFQGCPGTGKGMLVNEVLRPLFGASNVSIRRMSELADRFNEYIENTLLCFIDEIAIGEDSHHDKIMADLKQQITEPTLSIRKMHTAAREVPNYTNWIFSTNNKQPIKIEEGDRRYNVGDFCEIPLTDRVETYEFVKRIREELPAFTHYLMLRKADRVEAARVIHNEARQYMINSSMISADVLANAINNGDLMKLHEYVDDLGVTVDPIRVKKAEAYEALIKELILTQKDALSREELAIIFDSTVGKVPRESAKFTQYLGHHGIEIKVVRYKEKVFRGIKVKWKFDEEWMNERLAEIASIASMAKIIPLRK